MLSITFEIKNESGKWFIRNRSAKELFCGDDSFLDEIAPSQEQGFRLCLTVNPIGADYALKKDRVEDGKIVYKVKGRDRKIKIDLEALQLASYAPGTVYIKVLSISVQQVRKNNAMMSLLIFWNGHAWVFNAPEHGLQEEPFVAGADEMIDKMVEQQKIKDPKNGFVAVFSAQKFPTAQFELAWVEECSGGNYYRLEEMRGWLCPAMYNYFEVAPKSIFVEVKSRKE